MAYLKKKYRDLIKRIDKELKIPQGWYYFVKKEQLKQNLIIKTKGICTCKNCNTKFRSNKTINEYEKCPKCHNTYLIKKSNYSYHIFTKDLILVDELDNKYVIRLFEIFTRYTKNNIYHSKPAEYGRIVIDKETKEEIQFANDRVFSRMYGDMYINHIYGGKKWRIYNKYYRKFNISGKTYYKNLENILKKTEFKYSQLWELAKKSDSIDISNILCNYNPSIELLIKMGLYKLVNYSDKFNNGKSFKERFGVEKSYYNFMKANDISMKELEVLRIYKKTNIEDIRFFSKFSINDLKSIEKYVKLDKFICYARKYKRFDIKMYSDYLNFLNELNINMKDKINLFPEKLKKKHDEYSRQIIIKNNKKVNELINKRYEQLKNNTYRNKKYIVKPADSFISLEDESTQQNHCVRNYAERYAKGECDIYFMRKIEEPQKSLVTIEVRNKKIIQSRLKDNKEINKLQKNFLNRWEKNILNAA